jgi:hypothetical protein
VRKSICLAESLNYFSFSIFVSFLSLLSPEIISLFSVSVMLTPTAILVVLLNRLVNLLLERLLVKNYLRFRNYYCL